MSITEQAIRLKLENKGIPADVAEQAAELIHEKSDELVLASEKSLTFLIDAFVAVYRQDSQRALTVLEEKLV